MPRKKRVTIECPACHSEFEGYEGIEFPLRCPYCGSIVEWLIEGEENSEDYECWGMDSSSEDET